MKLSNEIIREKALQLGFSLAGFAAAEDLLLEHENLKAWLAKGFHADMEYMERNLEKRKSIKEIFPSAKSVISLGLNYYTPHKHSQNKNSGKISRYAWGEDYHLVIWKKLDEFAAALKKIDETFEAKTYVDTGPVMDKVWAVKSGIGWMGKHSNIINKNIGSWFFIATVITNYEFKFDLPIADHCGSCTACLDACPTGAIVDDYIIDSNKCISYLTIENKKEIPHEFKGNMDNWIFGCDVCQDVCPWNKKFSEETELQQFHPKNENVEVNLKSVLSMEQKEFSEKFKKSPVKRTKLKGLKRNAEFLLNK